MKDFLLEACVDSTASAEAAHRGGADRLELCSGLVVGGLTPGLSFFRQVKERTGMRVHVLIRPRFGDFCYSEEEFAVMAEDAKAFVEAGADGIVVGFLQPDGNLDLSRMRQIRELCGDRHLTLHRAFDVCADPFRALGEAKELGVNTILTSGQRDSALEGAALLHDLVQAAGGKVAAASIPPIWRSLPPRRAQKASICPPKKKKTVPWPIGNPMCIWDCL